MTTPSNRVRSGFYLDSVALMRLSQQVAALAGVSEAAMMIGTESNKAILDEAGLLAGNGRNAGPNDLIVAVRAASKSDADAALTEALALIDRPRSGGEDDDGWRPRSLDTAFSALPDANLALISVPGEYAAREARQALTRGLNVMIFSDNVPVAEEIALKEEARDRGLLVMGPDCGTALIAGVPLAFANEVPRGDIGIVSASGTGLQEVSTLIARLGGGVSHGIGVGGRDLGAEVGGIMTLAAIDALDADPETRRIVVISKPPAPDVARRILARIGESEKPFVVCLVGLDSAPELPGNARLAPTLKAAAELATDREMPVPEIAAPPSSGRWRICGLYSGGTLCAEAQTILCDAGEKVASNVPVPGASAVPAPECHSLIDLGADSYTVGRPHPMIDPAIRAAPLAEALAEPETAVVLLDVVIGHGAHADPAADVAARLAAFNCGPAVIASVCGTEQDPQVYSAQVATLRQAGVMVAPSNADAAAMALAVIRQQ